MKKKVGFGKWKSNRTIYGSLSNSVGRKNK